MGRELLDAEGVHARRLVSVVWVVSVVSVVSDEEGAASALDWEWEASQTLKVPDYTCQRPSSALRLPFPPAICPWKPSQSHPALL
jgi:hypothetical protein